MPPTDEPTPGREPSDEARHPFTYRGPTASAVEPTDDLEDERRRNDAVLRWAVILIAGVFAAATVADTAILVHVAVGRHLATHGVLPPANDALSATASVLERPWTNLGWGFDLVAAGVQAVGGATGLTVLAVVGAVAVAVLLFAGRRGTVSSWWASLAVALAVVAASPQFVARPTVVTLLGLAATLVLLARELRTGGGRWGLWPLVPLFVVWSNLDPRMFLGLAALLLFGVGELIGSLFDQPGFDDGERRRHFWFATGGTVAATLVNPFGWKAPLGAWLLYGRVDPAFREYYAGHEGWPGSEHQPLFAAGGSVWNDPPLLAALVLGAAALVTLVLNRRRVCGGDLLLWAGFCGFGLVAVREWPPAAVVFAAVAIRNAEDWYRETFRLRTSRGRGDLLFARGGRAATVLAFVALAVLWFAGRIDLGDGRRPGFGLDRGLANRLASLAVLTADEHDDRVFNFHARQGDLLLYVGRKPFLDGRLELFAGDGDDDLIDLHDDLRHALREQDHDDPRAGKRDVWQAAFDRFGITHVMPRLLPPVPDYRTYFDLLTSPDWRLTKLDAAGAVFYRSDAADPALDAYVAGHRPRFVERAFREPSDPPTESPTWPRPESWSDRWSRSGEPSNELIRAGHFVEHLEHNSSGSLRLDPGVAVALAHLAIRDLQASLARDPQSVDAHVLLGRTYEHLGLWEMRLSQASGVSMRPERRFYQAIESYGAALAVAPDDRLTHLRLVELYGALGKADLIRRSLEYVDEGDPAVSEDVNLAAAREKARQGIAKRIAGVAGRCREALDAKEPRLRVAQFAWQNGCTLHALELLDADPQLLATDPNAVKFRAMLLLEAARPEEAYQTLASIEQVASQAGLVGWREPFAYANLALPDYAAAARLWREDAAEVSESQLRAAAEAAPLTGLTSRFPDAQTAILGGVLMMAPPQIAANEFDAALCDLEAGRTEQAAKAFARLLDRHRFTPTAPLTAFYLSRMRPDLLPTTDAEQPAPDRFAAVDTALGEAAAARRIKSIGPVEALRPRPEPTPERPADRDAGQEPVRRGS